MRTRLNPRFSRTRAGLVLAAVLVVAGALVATGPSQASPAPVATQIAVTPVGTPSVNVPNTPGAPDAFAVVGAPFTIDVDLQGYVNGQLVDLPASTTKDTTLTVHVAQGSTGFANGSTLSVVVPAGASTATFSNLLFSKAANGVVLEVDGPPAKGKTPAPLTPGLSSEITVWGTVVTAGHDATLTSIGAGSGPSQACSPTKQQPVCADLLLPNGSVGGQLLSLGVCDGSGTDTNCPTDRSVVQALADVSNYSRSNPATLVVKCDKSSCGGGAIRNQQLVVNLSATGPLTVAPDCPAKGTVGPDQLFCVDYVQSTRDNAGDTLLYLLFIVDGRASFK